MNKKKWLHVAKSFLYISIGFAGGCISTALGGVLAHILIQRLGR